MNVVDSSCWLEYFADGPGADRYSDVIKDISGLVVPSIVLYEVFKKAVHERGEETALRDTAYMCRGQIIDLNAEIALAAAMIGLDLGLPLADSVILTTARMFNATLWTQDGHFKGIEGVKYFEKPIVG